MDRYVNPPAYLLAQRTRMDRQREEARRVPASPERDVLGFLLHHAPLDNWERDVLGIVREESYYFLPQRQTKVMNEGWASYWHSLIMTRRCLTDSEVIDYADHHSGTVAMQPGRLNPYKLGLELFRDIEQRWNRGQFGPDWDACDDMAERARWDRRLGLGRDKIFEVRKLHCDATFLDEFLTPEFCVEQKLFVRDDDADSDAPSHDFDEVKQALLFHFTNGGRPVIDVTDANHGNRSELLLTHRHAGVDLRVDWAREVMGNLTQLWKRPVRLRTQLKGRNVLLGHDGEKTTQEDLEDGQLTPSLR
jgi:stage V sporulation protein R